MVFEKTDIAGVLAVKLERRCDERGSFARTFCRREFAAHGLPADFVQCNTSVTRQAGTLRGMHFQRAPHAEAKLVRCVRGAVYDVVADLRPDSPTFMRWQSFRLEAHGDASLFIPAGCAHGLQALVDDTEVSYQMTAEYAPQYASGFRYDDPAFDIEWPLPVTVISSQDRSWPSLERPQETPGNLSEAESRAPASAAYFGHTVPDR